MHNSGTWVCFWKIQDAQLQENGREGSIDIEADDKRIAENTARDRVSKILFGTTSLKDCVQISSVEQRRY